ncbi:zinc-dependent peptidase [Bizionia myxarmorum]|uniref:Zinc-dependent peptidase n=1 Tax=Bizionia myxarmorum TaxID=291186 RepID=A0A5D0RF91_9FLAO|nr:zinc-dependent peptidase [Bizionia myxarmorum]TYB79224.1 zinc-dependent peptidase [Bizionia myxarmorum]
MFELEEIPLFYKVMAIFLVMALSTLVIYAIVNMVDTGYVLIKRKPLYRYLLPPSKKLPAKQQHLLQSQFRFYQRLSDKQKLVFNHRLAYFIKSKTFVTRDNLDLTDEIIVMTSATAVMLTFGFRDYKLKMISHIIVYPSAFYSETNEEHHKGEYNPRLKALVLSWEHFMEGYSNSNDNLNLGIHEFAHAIHFNSLRNRDVSSMIFADSFKELSEVLAAEPELRQRLLNSGYIRNYAYTNPYEFVAVIIENFIETPTEFRAQFPRVYAKTKQMLNFHFDGY